MDSIAWQCVKNVVFDLGGVILNIDHALTNQAFVGLGVPDLFGRYKELKTENYFDQYESGRITSEQFYQVVCDDFSVQPSFDEFRRAWNQLLRDISPHKVKLLQALKKLGRHRLRTFILSNTNELHITAFTQHLKQDHGVDGLDSLVERVYYSCRMGMRKPEHQIYNHLLHDSKLIAAQTLFIDDSQSNIDAARVVGLQGLHLDKGMDLIALFDGLSI